MVDLMPYIGIGFGVHFAIIMIAFSIRKAFGLFEVSTDSNI